MNFIALILFISTVIINNEFETNSQIFSIILTSLPIYFELLSISYVRGLYFKFKYIVAGTAEDIFKDHLVEMNKKCEFTNFHNNFMNGCDNGKITKMYFDELNNNDLYFDFSNDVYSTEIDNVILDKNNYISKHYFKDHTFEYYSTVLGDILKITNTQHERIKSFFKIDAAEHGNLIEFIRKDKYFIIEKRTRYLDGVAHKLNYFEKIGLFILKKDKIRTNEYRLLMNDSEWFELIIPFIFYIPLFLMGLFLFIIGFSFIIPISYVFLSIFLNEKIAIMITNKLTNIGISMFNHRKSGFVIMGLKEIKVKKDYNHLKSNLLIESISRYFCVPESTIFDTNRKIIWK